MPDRPEMTDDELEQEIALLGSLVSLANATDAPVSRADLDLALGIPVAASQGAVG